jgi:hypothetical protein
MHGLNYVQQEEKRYLAEKKIWETGLKIMEMLLSFYIYIIIPLMDLINHH